MRITDRGWFRGLLLACIYTLGVLGIVASGGGGGSGGITMPLPIVPKFAYVANSNSNTVSMYTVDSSTGNLRHNGYVAAGTNPQSVTVDSSGQFAYVANFQSDDVSAYTIDPATGVLSSVGATVMAGTGPVSEHPRV